MSMFELLRSARETYFSWTAIKGHFRFGAPSMKYSGYEAGRLAHKKALIKRVRRARAKYELAEARLDGFMEAETSRKAEARKRA